MADVEEQKPFEVGEDVWLQFEANQIPYLRVGCNIVADGYTGILVHLDKSDNTGLVRITHVAGKRNG